MSVISTYKEPQDVLFKLLREGRRTWLALDPQEKCDHFFNYCVTAHALRDWCIKYLNLTGADKDNFHTEMNSIMYFGECRDIANSSKHFGLDSKTSLISDAFPTESEFAVITGEENHEQYEKVKRRDLAISLASGVSLDLFGFLHHTSTNWIEVLKRKNIPINPGYSPIYIFIEYR